MSKLMITALWFLQLTPTFGQTFVPPVKDVQVLRLYIRSDDLFHLTFADGGSLPLPYVDCTTAHLFRLYVIPAGPPELLDQWLRGTFVALIGSVPQGPFLPKGNPWPVDNLYSYELTCMAGSTGKFSLGLPVWQKAYPPFLTYTIELHEDAP